jgi:F420-non-reducing hydrogenase iron-sulfur subunit
MCSGRVQPSLVLRAFELGADGVIVCGCEPGTCHYYFGNERQAEMFETSRKLVSLLGLGEERLRLEWVSGKDGRGLGKVLDEFTEKVRHAGPSPLQKTRRNR